MCIAQGQSVDEQRLRRQTEAFEQKENVKTLPLLAAVVMLLALIGVNNVFRYQAQLAIEEYHYAYHWIASVTIDCIMPCVVLFFLWLSHTKHKTLLGYSTEFFLVFFYALNVGKQMWPSSRNQDWESLNFSLQRMAYVDFSIVVLNISSSRNRRLFRCSVYGIGMLMIVSLGVDSAKQFILALVSVFVSKCVIEVLHSHQVGLTNKLFLKKRSLKVANEQRLLILNQITVGAAIIDIEKKQCGIQYFNDTMAKILSNWDSSIGLFYSKDSIDSSDLGRLFSQKRLVYVEQFQQVEQVINSVNETDGESQLTSVLDLLSSEEGKSELDEVGRFYLVLPNGLNSSQRQHKRLIHVSKKQLEFNDKDCEMVLITDRTQEMVLCDTLTKETESYIKQLAQVNEFCLQTVQTCEQLQQNCRFDQLSSLEDMLLQAERTKFKLLDRLDYEKCKARDFASANSEFCVRDMFGHLKRILLHTTKHKRVDWDVHFDPTVPPKVSGDKQRINQVLINLLENASLFSENKTKLEVRVKYGFKQLTTEIVNKSRLKFLAQDNSLFRKFFKVEGSDQLNEDGLGLGLFFSKKICQKIIKGSLNYTNESPQNQGLSLFLFEFSFDDHSDSDTAPVPPVIAGQGRSEISLDEASELNQSLQQVAPQQERDDLGKEHLLTENPTNQQETGRLGATH